MARIKNDREDEERIFRKEHREYLASLSDDERAFRKSVNGLAFEKDIALGHYIVKKEITAWEKEHGSYDGEPNIYVIISLGDDPSNLDNAFAVGYGPLFQLEKDPQQVLGKITADRRRYKDKWLICPAFIEDLLSDPACILHAPKKPIAYSTDLKTWINKTLPKLHWPTLIKGLDFDLVYQL